MSRQKVSRRILRAKDQVKVPLLAQPVALEGITQAVRGLDR
jgi:hypothetical protein